MSLIIVNISWGVVWRTHGPGLLPEPVFCQDFSCSELGREEISRIQSLIHKGKKPLVGTKVFPFKLVEPPSERSRLLNSTFSQINEWRIHLYLSRDLYPILSGC